MLDRRALLKVAGVLFAARGMAGAAEPGLYRVKEKEVLMAAVRMLLGEDAVGTLITVDAELQPRARSVVVSKPDQDLTLWMGTRPGSRKLEQLAHNPRATLHFAVDGQAAYASLMGRARVYRERELIAAKNPFSGEKRREFFPRYPEDFALIGFRTEWLEVVVDGVKPREDTWQPQGMRI